VHERERLRPKRARQARRRQLVERLGEEIDRREVWAAWNGRCALCGRPLAFADVELDHVLEVSAVDRGADPALIHRRANVRPVHGECNRRRNRKRRTP
jgi:hypothetical protein